MASKDQKAFLKELKPVYQAVSKEMAEQEFEKLAESWSKKYPVVIGSSGAATGINSLLTSSTPPPSESSFTPQIPLRDIIAKSVK